jgi:hypothetical protein
MTRRGSVGSSFGFDSASPAVLFLIQGLSLFRWKQV